MFVFACVLTLLHCRNILANTPYSSNEAVEREKVLDMKEKQLTRGEGSLLCRKKIFIQHDPIRQ